MQSGKSTILVKAAKAVKSGVGESRRGGGRGRSFHIGVFEAQ